MLMGQTIFVGKFPDNVRLDGQMHFIHAQMIDPANWNQFFFLRESSADHEVRDSVFMRTGQDFDHMAYRPAVTGQNPRTLFDGDSALRNIQLSFRAIRWFDARPHAR